MLKTNAAAFCALLLHAVPVFGQVANFDKDQPGWTPTGFSFGLTGKGKPGVWVVKADPTPISG